MRPKCILFGIFATFIILDVAIWEQILTHPPAPTVSSKSLVKGSFQLFALNEAMWADNPGRNISVCVVVRTWSRHANCLGAFLASLAAASHKNVTVSVIDTGRNGKFTQLDSIVKQFNLMVGFDMVHVSKWASRNSRELYPAISDVEDWGYIATDLALRDFLERNRDAEAEGKQLPCMAIHITNGDNIMANTYFLHTLKAMAQGYNMVGVNFVHHTQHKGMVGVNISTLDEMNNSSDCGGWRPGIDYEFFTQFRRICVDLAAVVTSASLWTHGNGTDFSITTLRDYHMRNESVNKVKLRHSLFTADGTIFQGFLNLSITKPYIVRKVLLFHQ